MKEIITTFIVLVFCLLISYLLALAGEPQSKWIVCDVLKLCGENK